MNNKLSMLKRTMRKAKLAGKLGQENERGRERVFMFLPQFSCQLLEFVTLTARRGLDFPALSEAKNPGCLFQHLSRRDSPLRSE
jgi:hypothetical protein